MDDLLDPLGDRVMKNVPPIARFPLKRDQLWHKSGKISIHLYIPNPISNLLNIIFELNWYSKNTINHPGLLWKWKNLQFNLTNIFNSEEQ